MDIKIDYRKDNHWTVYIHIVPKEISGYEHDKYYVGITSFKPQARWQKDGYGYHTQYFYKAIQKYGWDNIEHIILASNITKNEATKMETKMINLLHSSESTYGYNVSNGGFGVLGVQAHNRKDIAGQRFGRLTAICPSSEKYYPPNSRPMLIWFCKCDCGNYVNVLATNLFNGNTKSCGCLSKEVKEKKKLNEATDTGEYIIMHTNRQDIFIDYDDYEKIKDKTWYINKTNNEVYSDNRRGENRKLFVLKNCLFDIFHSKTKKVKLLFKNNNNFDYRRCNIELIFPEGVDKNDYIEYLKSDINNIFFNQRQKKKYTIRVKNTYNKSFYTFKELLDYRQQLEE